jgi:hypothetical protein
VAILETREPRPAIGLLGKVLAGVIVLGVIVIAFLWFTKLPSGTGNGIASGHTVTGILTVVDDYAGAMSGSFCNGKGGYADLKNGVQVLIEDKSGTILEKGELGGGTVTNGYCDFPFTIWNVPASDFYQVEIGRRGGLTYTKAEMEAAGWTLALSIGD